MASNKLDFHTGAIVNPLEGLQTAVAQVGSTFDKYVTRQEEAERYERQQARLDAADKRTTDEYNFQVAQREALLKAPSEANAITDKINLEQVVKLREDADKRLYAPSFGDVGSADLDVLNKVHDRSIGLDGLAVERNNVARILAGNAKGAALNTQIDTAVAGRAKALGVAPEVLRNYLGNDIVAESTTVVGKGIYDSTDTVDERSAIGQHTVSKIDATKRIMAELMNRGVPLTAVPALAEAYGGNYYDPTIAQARAQKNFENMVAVKKADTDMIRASIGGRNILGEDANGNPIAVTLPSGYSSTGYSSTGNAGSTSKSKLSSDDKALNAINDSMVIPKETSWYDGWTPTKESTTKAFGDTIAAGMQREDLKALGVTPADFNMAMAKADSNSILASYRNEDSKLWGGKDLLEIMIPHVKATAEARQKAGTGVAGVPLGAPMRDAELMAAYKATFDTGASGESRRNALAGNIVNAASRSYWDQYAPKSATATAPVTNAKQTIPLIERAAILGVTPEQLTALDNAGEDGALVGGTVKSVNGWAREAAKMLPPPPTIAIAIKEPTKENVAVAVKDFGVRLADKGIDAKAIKYAQERAVNGNSLDELIRMDMTGGTVGGLTDSAASVYNMGRVGLSAAGGGIADSLGTVRDKFLHGADWRQAVKANFDREKDSVGKFAAARSNLGDNTIGRASDDATAAFERSAIANGSGNATVIYRHDVLKDPTVDYNEYMNARADLRNDGAKDAGVDAVVASAAAVAARPLLQGLKQGAGKLIPLVSRTPAVPKSVPAVPKSVPVVSREAVRASEKAERVMDIPSITRRSAEQALSGQSAVRSAGAGKLTADGIASGINAARYSKVIDNAPDAIKAIAAKVASNSATAAEKSLLNNFINMSSRAAVLGK